MLAFSLRGKSGVITLGFSDLGKLPAETRKN
jgi:hypothetical protein